MRVTIHQKDLEITPSLREYIETKIKKSLKPLLRHGDDSFGTPTLDLEFSRTTRHHRKGMVYYAEANVTLGKEVLRVSATAPDIRAASDALESELRRGVIGYQTKKKSVDVRKARSIKKDIRLDPAARLRRKGRIREEGI
jgi:ribosomal subunit interface protein